MQPASSTPYEIMENRPGFSPRYSSGGGITTGVIQLICGLAVVVLGIVSHTMALTWSFIGTGIWSGLLFFGIAGLLGILSAKKSSCLVIGYMIMSILSAIVAFFAGCTYLYVITVVPVEACPIIDTFEQVYDSSEESFNIPNIPSGIINCTNPTADLAVNACLVAIFFIEFLVAIIGSGFGCGGVCCGTNSSSTTHTTTVVTSQPLGAWPGQQQGYPAAQVQQGYTTAPQGYTAAPPNFNAQKI